MKAPYLPRLLNRLASTPGLGCWLIPFCGLLLLFPAIALGDPALEGDRDSSSASAERPRIGLVLSGGGARGGAHLGVLRVLEELEVPVDVVVGTSGGAIVGGLYASGWSPDEIETWLREMDWDTALSDRLPRRSLAYRAKEDDERFLFDLEVSWADGVLHLPQGLIEGRNLAFLLEQASLRTADVRDFNDLPIPFRAVATDLESGSKKVLDSGRLSKAIRASMSVPGVFAPVLVDDHLLVDGGLVENLPVETALDEGADIIIAVNVGSPLQERSELNDIFALSVQVTTLVLHNNLQRALGLLAESDILIEPELDGLNAQDFHRAADAAAAGERAAWDKHLALRGLGIATSDHQRFLEDQRLDPDDFGEVYAIEFRGLRRLSVRRLEALMETREGEPLALNVLQGDISRLQQLGEIESVDFRVDSRDNDSKLILDVVERDQGPHHLRLGLEMFDDFDGGAHYNLRIGHTRPSINRLGAEWRNEVQLGQMRAIRTEFFQPLSPAGRFFLSGLLSHEASVISAFDDGDRLADISTRNSRAGMDAGLRFGAHGEARLGAWRVRQTNEARIGQAGMDGEALYLSGNRLLLRYDRLDHAEWPSEGQFFEGHLEQAAESMGSDREFRRESAQLAHFWKREQHRFMLAGEWGQGDRPLGFQQQFPLGGPTSLSGYRSGELRADRVAGLRAVWFRQMGAPELGSGAGAFYAGAGIAAGAGWDHGQGTPSDEIAYGGKLFMGAATPLGPILFGAAQSDKGKREFFLTLGLPIHRPRPQSWPW
ncbi:NTE family protein [Natronospira proteinivora]|uniref:NTE family protein n=1 Tax=Natronospira proteinivora TaxID=1807133 RepID=A0ABT1G682_9GAMM|nr:patatin-like phospholipase family protein [Natronospira proteinivora]MCP1726804.1 NTE family protein [Natronospira proteinivora]